MTEVTSLSADDVIGRSLYQFCYVSDLATLRHAHIEGATPRIGLLNLFAVYISSWKDCIMCVQSSPRISLPFLPQRGLKPKLYLTHLTTQSVWQFGDSNFNNIGRARKMRLRPTPCPKKWEQDIFNSKPNFDKSVYFSIILRVLDYIYFAHILQISTVYFRRRTIKKQQRPRVSIIQKQQTVESWFHCAIGLTLLIKFELDRMFLCTIFSLLQFKSMVDNFDYFKRTLRSIKTC